MKTYLQDSTCYGGAMAVSPRHGPCEDINQPKKRPNLVKFSPRLKLYRVKFQIHPFETGSVAQTPNQKLLTHFHARKPHPNF